MRYLEFNDVLGSERYGMIYEGIIGSTRGFDGRTEARVIGKVLDKLEAIGQPVQKEDRATFALSGHGTVALEDAEYKLLLDTLSSVKWTAKFSRLVARTFDWLANAPQEPSVKPTLVREEKHG
jgi:hypothetical protein